MGVPIGPPSAIPSMLGDATPIPPNVNLTPLENPEDLKDLDFQDETPGEIAELTEGFEDNLALTMLEYDLNMVSLEILEGIQSDIESRADWEAWYEKGLELLGLKMENASGDASSMGTVSKVYDQTLLESVIKYQSNARGELLPSDGPVKVRVDSPEPSEDQSKLANALENDVNHYLTVVAREYYPDFDRMLFDLGFCGVAFRKLYHCPIRNRPVDEWVPAIDLIVSNNATTLENAGRYTHRIMMLQSTLRRLQISGFYSDISIIAPNEDLDEAQKKIMDIEGISPLNKLPRDQRHTIYETYVDLDSQFWDEYGKKAQFPLPYRVTIDKNSQKVLEIRRNWKENDEDFKAKKRFVKYGYIPGLGFYDYGLVHLLGNNERALTAIERQLVDAGQFANFPGFLYVKQAGRQDTNQIRIPPGSGHGIDTGGMPIGNSVMPLPYQGPNQTLFELKKDIEAASQRLSGAAEVPVGEGNLDIPVGTMVALVEQSTKIVSAVHKRNHASQQEEFEILRELFMEDPEALWRFARNPARKWQMAEELIDLELVTAADPNTPSKIHRIMKAQALGQLVAAYPQYFKVDVVLRQMLGILGYGDLDSIMADPSQVQQKQMTPEQQTLQMQAQAREMEQQREIQQDALRGQMKINEINLQNSNDEADRQSKQKIESLKYTQNLAKIDLEKKKLESPLGKINNGPLGKTKKN